MTEETKPAGLTRSDLLIGLIEECGEVIQAATKCLRFGFDSDDHRLALEVGDVLGIVDALPFNRELVERVESCRATKVRRMAVAKSRFGVTESNTQPPVAWLKDVGGPGPDGAHDACYVPAAQGDPGAFPVYR